MKDSVHHLHQLFRYNGLSMKAHPVVEHQGDKVQEFPVSSTTRIVSRVSVNEPAIGSVPNPDTDKRCEGDRIEAGSAHEESVDLRLGHKALRVVGRDAAPV